MNVREKLVEIIQNSVGGCARHWAEIIADGLTANGVTIQEWISVEDMPFEEYEYKVVLYYDGKDVDVCHILGGDFVDLHSSYMRRVDGVTHWMPLPAPPKGE